MQALEAWSGGVSVRCPVCASTHFLEREVKIQTTGMTFMGLDWANESGVGMACVRCGLLLTFVGESLRVRTVDVDVAQQANQA